MTFETDKTYHKQRSPPKTTNSNNKTTTTTITTPTTNLALNMESRRFNCYLGSYLLQHHRLHAFYMNLKQNGDVPLVEFMYLVFTRIPGENYRRRLRSLLLRLCDVFRALIYSLACWFIAAVSIQILKTAPKYINFVCKTNECRREFLDFNQSGRGEVGKVKCCRRICKFHLLGAKIRILPE